MSWSTPGDEHRADGFPALNLPKDERAPAGLVLQELLVLLGEACAASVAFLVATHPRLYLATGEVNEGLLRSAIKLTWEIPGQPTCTEVDLSGSGEAQMDGSRAPVDFAWFAGRPIRDESGQIVGAVCVADRQSRRLTDRQRESFASLTRRVEHWLPRTIASPAGVAVASSIAEKREADRIQSQARERTAELNTLLEWMREEEAQSRKEAEMQRRRGEQIQRFEAALLALVTTPAPTFAEAMRAITRTVARAVEVERVSIWMFDEERTELRCRDLYLASGDAHERDAVIRAADCPRYFAELRKSLTLAVKDTLQDERTLELREQLLAKSGVKALLSVPIRIAGELAGVLVHGETQGVRDWHQYEIDFASAVAGIVAVSIEAEMRQRTEEQLHALAAHLESVREEERAALARELHDVVGQLLTALRMDTAWLGKMCVDDPQKMIARGPERLKAMKELIDEAVATIQRISSELRPGALNELGLVAALEWQVGEFQQRSGINTRFDGPEGPVSPGDRHGLVLYRALQEALTNVARHSGATDVTVRLLVEETSIALEVSDNGRGMPAGVVEAASSLGLIGMRERATVLGGTLSFSSAPDRGTTVRMRLPILRSAPSS